MEFQLKLTRDELEKANAQLKSTEEKYKKEITELQTEKQNMDIELLKAKSNNKDLNRQLEALNQELSTMTRNCKRLAIKATEYRRLGKNWITQTGLNIFKMRIITLKKDTETQISRPVTLSSCITLPLIQFTTPPRF